MSHQLNINLDLDKMTAGQLAHLYIAVVKTGRLEDAKFIDDALRANCGLAEAVKIVGEINTVEC